MGWRKKIHKFFYYGPGKPKDFNHFLIKFVEEALPLTNGEKQFIIAGHDFKLEFSTWICDLPALSGAMGLHHHNFAYGCIRCTVERKSVERKKGRKITKGTFFILA